MNDQQFRVWLSEQAPGGAPPALRARVIGIPTMAEPVSVDTPRVRGLSGLPRGRRMLAVGLVAAALVGSMLAVGAGSFLRRDDGLDVAAVMARNGVILLLIDGHPAIIDPVTGASRSNDDPTALTGLQEHRLDLNDLNEIAWSPDGRTVAFFAPNSVVLMDVRSGARRAIDQTTFCDCDLAWSPDGAVIALTNATRIELLDVETGNLDVIADLGSEPRSPSWSPDGRSIAFALDRELQVVNRDGTGLRTLHTEVEDSIGPVDVSWSPDGSRIGYIGSGAFEGESLQDGAGWHLEVVAVDADGTNRRVLADGGRCYCVGWGPPGFAWSPDGTSIAYTSPGSEVVQPPQRPLVNGGLYVAAVDGTGPRLVRPNVGGSPEWQPLP